MCIRFVLSNMTQWAKPIDCCVIFKLAGSGTELFKPKKQDHGLHTHIALQGWFRNALIM